ncbi:hypothetical protein IGI44_004215 [Enterococcus sp. DIV0756]
MRNIANYFEIMMVLCFGLSWPLSVYKSYVSRTSEGKSLFFECFIFTGYIFGIVGKVLNGTISYVVIFYVINLVIVGVDICLYFRNRRLDKERERLCLEDEKEVA